MAAQQKTLDLSALEKALASLERAVMRAQCAKEDTELRDAVIQRFEYTYELCWRMLKRRLELDVATSSAVDSMSFRQLIREGAERGLLENPESWFVYREQRNITAHTYNEGKARSVYLTAIEFLPDAKALLIAIKQSSL